MEETSLDLFGMLTTIEPPPAIALQKIAGSADWLWLWQLISLFLLVAVITLGLYITRLTRVLKSRKNLRQLDYFSENELPNRKTLQEDLQQYFAADPSGASLLLYIDIDHFRFINETLGHQVGDLLLQQVKQRLHSCLPEGALLYRVGADEFIIVVKGRRGAEEEGPKLWEQLMKAFLIPFIVQGSDLFISISMGIAMSPEHGADDVTLLMNADIAMHRSKEAGRNTYTIYDPSMKRVLSTRINMVKHLRSALDHDEFEVYYQPQVLAMTGEIIGFEALIRWNNPELGAVSPVDFIGVAEDTRLIIPIGEWVLLTACAFLKELHEQGREGLKISVNISVVQLRQDDFESSLFGILDEVGLEARYLELELTESVFMESTGLLVDKLRRLKECGIGIALDDFGTGYSSLSYLQNLPITTLKVDKAFIDSLSDECEGKPLADAIIMIGRNLELEVVAEGVETQDQYAYLQQHQCDRLQGYLISRPVPESEAVALLELKR